MRIYKMTKIDLHTIIIFLALIWSIQFAYLDTVPLISLLYQFSFIGMGAYILFVSQKVRICPINILVFMLNIALWISTVWNTGFSIYTTSYVVNTILYTIMLGQMLRKEPIKTINILAFIFESAVYLNALLQIVFPNGLYYPETGENRYFLFGHWNQLGVFIPIAYTLSAVRSVLHGKTDKVDIRLCFLFVVGLLSAISVWSATSVVGCLLFLIVYFWEKLRKKAFEFSPYIAVAINAVFFFVVVVLSSTDWMSKILALLGKNTTFSGRTSIWETAIDSVLKNPWLGVGFGQGDDLFGFSTAHNWYLNTLFTSGVFGFVIGFALILYCCKLLNKYKDNPCIRGVTAYFWAILVMFQFETYQTSIIFSIFVVLQNMDAIIKQVASE